MHQDDTSGELRVTLLYQHQGSDLRLVATYPAEYPFFSPFVTGPEMALDRHHHPISKELCLLGDIGRDWSVEHTLAWLLEHQLPRSLEAAAQPEDQAAADNESHQGEPWTEYPSYRAGSQIVVPGLQIPENIQSGKLVWALQRPSPVRGVILRVFDDNKNLLCEAEPWWQAHCAGMVQQHGSWIRIRENPIVDNDKAHFASVNPQFARNPRSAGKKVRVRLAVTIYPEESQWRERADGWIVSAHGPVDQRGTTGFTYARASRGGEEELFARIPELHPLRGKRIMVVGLGMLGSPAALQFARAGAVHLTLVDHDFIEFGTIVRWGLGSSTSGWFKSDCLAGHIRVQYPYVTAEPMQYRIGQACDSSSTAIANAFDEALRSADLVFDAAANDCVSNYLRYRCEELGIPHIWISTTQGGWGGVVGRSIPGKTGCWSCMMRHQSDWAPDAESKEVIPRAIQKEEENIQPTGCTSPTVTGAGIDTDIVVLQGMRLAIGTLCRGHADSYPDVDWDVAILELRDSSKDRSALNCWTGRLQPHKDCNHA